MNIFFIYAGFIQVLHKSDFVHKTIAHAKFYGERERVDTSVFKFFIGLKGLYQLSLYFKGWFIEWLKNIFIILKSYGTPHSGTLLSQFCKYGRHILIQNCVNAL